MIELLARVRGLWYRWVAGGSQKHRAGSVGSSHTGKSFRDWQLQSTSTVDCLIKLHRLKLIWQLDKIANYSEGIKDSRVQKCSVISYRPDMNSFSLENSR